MMHLKGSLVASCLAGMIYRNLVFAVAAVSLSGCIAAAPLLMEPGSGLLDGAADKYYINSLREKHPSVDPNDLKALEHAEYYANLSRQFPHVNSNDKAALDRALIKHARSHPIAGEAAAAPLAATPVKAATNPLKQSAVRADQAALKSASASWVNIHKSMPYDIVSFAPVALHACGVISVQYSINDGPSQTQSFTGCGTANPKPNPPYKSARANSVQMLKVVMTFADGTSKTRKFLREEVFTTARFE